MSNYIEYNGKIAFHPGYYIKEIVEESGLTQEDFAKRLDTTPKKSKFALAWQAEPFCRYGNEACQNGWNKF